MEQISRVEIKQAGVLIIGLVLVFLWFRPGHQTTQTEVIQEPKAAVDYLEIPKLSISAPIIYVASNDEIQIQAGLEQGIVHYFGTAQPGEVGNSYLVGHSSDYPQAPGNYKQIFAQLPKLFLGDLILVKQAGQTLEFQVVATKIIEANDLSVLNQETAGRKILTLQTSYPIGTALKRFIVAAELK